MTETSGPYARAAQVYWKKGWHPFPVKGKSEAIPKGVTGLEAKDPGWGQIQEWLAKRPFSNVALRANGWVAIDVDGPDGVTSLAKAVERLGELPATWVSTSWGSATADRRQLFYRVPVGFSVRLAEGRFVKTFGRGVDILHKGHRYAVVAPSKHPDTGNIYAWYRPDGEAGGKVLPNRMDDLPLLPQGWLDFLQEQDKTAPQTKGTDEDGFYDPVTDDHGWTRTAAQAEVDRMLSRIRTVDSNVNTQAGGAMREIGRFVPALLSQDQAITLAVDALEANPWHSDDWNKANGKDWTALTLASTSISRGMEEAREVLADGADPEPQADGERYTDAFMSARLVREALAGRFLYTAALGWLKHDGIRWASVKDEIVHEATRQWTLAGYLAAVETYRRAAAAGAVDWAIGEDPDIKGWASLQNAGRITNVVRLARGIESMFREASEFDRDPALLNTPSGVVDLRTGHIIPHDPAQMITKVTGVGYVPGAEHLALKTALQALPEDALEWIQLMLGEAVTGHSGERMVLLTGGGRNGKTALMGAVYRALGEYAAKVPNTLLLKSKSQGAATPERMTLRGIRLAYMEETPEDGYLDANVVKDLLDAEVIDGRYLYRDTISWTPTHSIFLNTNHPPTVTATDEGTWRRMARVDFPYRYRRVGEALEKETDRHGDPRLKTTMTTNAGAQAALLAWMVAGAIRFYAAGSIEEAGPTPASVRGSILKWREDSDDILRFMGVEMVFDEDSWVSGADLYRTFTRWLKNNGQMSISSRTFVSRLEGHTGLPGPIGKVQRLKTAKGLSRPALLPDGLAEPLPGKVKGYAGIGFAADDSAFELEE